MPEPFQKVESSPPSDSLTKGFDGEVTEDFALTPENWVLVEGADDEISLGPYVVWRWEGALWEIEDIAEHFGVTVQEVKERLGWAGSGDVADDAGDGVDDGDDAAYAGGDRAYDGGGMGGDIGVDTMSTDELDADLDQGTARKTVRGVDLGAVAAIREVIGAKHDSEAIRKAVLLAKDVLVRD